MEKLKLSNRLTQFLSQYKYVVFILLLGILLMAWPNTKKQSVPEIHTEDADTKASVEDKLSDILSKIQGVGRTEVMLTEAYGSETIYQANEDRSESDTNQTIRQETVILTDSQRGHQGLVKSVNPPVYLGAVVICQGADDSSVKLAVTNAVACVTGLGADRITVLKMKG